MGRVYILLKQIGINVKNLKYDITVASYILDPTEGKYLIDNLIEKYLDLNNLSWDDCMAFGDAQNDIFMLEKARISVTFSNSLDDVKQNCTYITDLCANDGVYKALKHFEII